MTDEMLDVARDERADRGGADRLRERRVPQRPHPGSGARSGKARRGIEGAADHRRRFVSARRRARAGTARQASARRDRSVDVVVSNCVLNLVEPKSKRQLFEEIFRVLQKGGRAVISDIVSDEEVPEHLQNDPELWSGCISGALTEEGFLAGFQRGRVLRNPNPEARREAVADGGGNRVSLRHRRGVQGQTRALLRAQPGGDLSRAVHAKCSTTTITGWSAACATRFATRPTISIARRPTRVFRVRRTAERHSARARRSRSIARTPPGGIRRKPRARITRSRPKRAVAATAEAVADASSALR